MTGVQRENSEDRTNAADTYFLINKQARKRAEEKQAEVTDSKRRKHIEPHQKNSEFEIPSTEANKHNESTDEQTNH
eukprot:2437435-Heterocapsa_arctica.AAC.1